MASTSSGNQEKLTREQRREQKKQARADRGPGAFSQFKQAYEITRKSDPNIPWILLGVFLVTVLVLLGLGLLLGNWLTWLLIGIPLGVLLALFVLSRRARSAMYGQIEGRPGASGAVLQDLGRGWVVEQEPVDFTRHQDLVFRAIGKPGIVLVTEGSRGRLKPVVAKQEKSVRRVAPNVPVHVFSVGKEEGQVPIKRLPKEIKALPGKLTTEEIHEVNKRLASLRKTLPIPKGVDPMRARPDRRGMRG